MYHPPIIHKHASPHHLSSFSTASHHHHKKQQPAILCGSFVRNKRSLVAVTWSITCWLTFVALLVATAAILHVEWTTHENNNKDEEGQHNNDNANLTSHSMILVAVIMIVIAVSLGLYGSTTIVGFTSWYGVYIAPCLSLEYWAPQYPTLQVGIFGGIVVFFSNLLLITAVIFGEVRVVQKQQHHNNNNNNNYWYEEKDQDELFAIEKIATIMAVTCMFLAALYIVFALLLFLYIGSSTSEVSNHNLHESVRHHHPYHPHSHYRTTAVEPSATTTTTSTSTTTAPHSIHNNPTTTVVPPPLTQPSSQLE